MTLMNTSGAAISGIDGISLISDVGALDAAQWKSVTNNYDGNSGGGVDSNDNWAIDSSARELLSESMLTGGPENGGSLTINQSVDLDVAPLSEPGTWIKSPYEDVRMEFSLIGGGTRTVDVNFVGNDGAKWRVGDLDFDNDIDVDDWLTFIAHNEEDLSAYSLAEAYQRGDLDKDGTNSVEDFGLFVSAFESDNGGAGSFAQMLASLQVPEPSSIVLALFAAVGLASTRRGSRRRRGCSASMHLQYSSHTSPQQNDRGTIMHAWGFRNKLLLLAIMVTLTAVALPVRAAILEEFNFNETNGTTLDSVDNTGTAAHSIVLGGTRGARRSPTMDLSASTTLRRLSPPPTSTSIMSRLGKSGSWRKWLGGTTRVQLRLYPPCCGSPFSITTAPVEARLPHKCRLIAPIPGLSNWPPAH